MNKIELKIRAARPEDAEKTAKLEGLCFPPDEAASLESFKERLAVFSDSFFVGEIEGEIVTFINGSVADSPVIYDAMYHDMSEHKPEGLYQVIFGLCTHPSYQRMGLAKVILEYMIASAKKRGKKGVILTCKEHLLKYYEKAGFVNNGISGSTHGGAVWYDMRLEF